MAHWEQMPLYLKAMEIRQLVDSIVEIAFESDMAFENEVEGHIVDSSINYLVENSLTIPSKVAGAFAEDTPYDLKMENATLIRRAARELMTDANTLEHYGFKEADYLDLLRKALEELRILFAEWVQTFDPWNYHIDRWGLFNPPGVHYDDYDMDEELNREAEEEENEFGTEDDDESRWLSGDDEDFDDDEDE